MNAGQISNPIANVLIASSKEIFVLWSLMVLFVWGPSHRRDVALSAPAIIGVVTGVLVLKSVQIQNPLDNGLPTILAN